MIGGQGRPEGPSRVARCRLNPNLVKAAIAKHFAVGDAIECHTSSKTEMTRPGLSGQRTGEAQDRLLRHTLNRGRKIHVDLLEPIVRFSHWYAEQFGKALVGHRQPRAIIKIPLIEPEAAVVLQID